MNYCTQCGEGVELKIPADDNRMRYVCNSCDFIHYENPKIVAGVLPIWEDKVLLCKRAIQPRYGLWTLPAGFMENGETIEEGALREAQEEANLSLHNLQLYTVLSLPHINQIYMMFKGDITTDTFSPGVESLETRLFSEADIPWDQLAFHVIKTTLNYYFEDREKQIYPIRNLP